MDCLDQFKAFQVGWQQQQQIDLLQHQAVIYAVLSTLNHRLHLADCCPTTSAPHDVFCLQTRPLDGVLFCRCACSTTLSTLLKSWRPMTVRHQKVQMRERAAALMQVPRKQQQQHLHLRSSQQRRRGRVERVLAAVTDSHCFDTQRCIQRCFSCEERRWLCAELLCVLAAATSLQRAQHTSVSHGTHTDLLACPPFRPVFPWLSCGFKPALQSVQGTAARPGGCALPSSWVVSLLGCGDTKISHDTSCCCCRAGHGGRKHLPRADGDVLVLCKQLSGLQLVHSAQRPGQTLPQQLPGERHILHEAAAVGTHVSVAARSLHAKHNWPLQAEQMCCPSQQCSSAQQQQQQ